MIGFKTLATFILFGLSAESFAATEVVGRIAFMSGEVRVNQKPSQKGQQLFEKDIVKTSPEAKATLLLGKGTVIHLDSDSELKITQYAIDKSSGTSQEDASLELPYGTTRALIEKKPGDKKTFKLRSRSAVMGVRGTQFVMSSPKDVAEPMQVVMVEGVGEFHAQAPASGSSSGSSGSSSSGNSTDSGSASGTPTGAPSADGAGSADAGAPAPLVMRENDSAQVGGAVAPGAPPPPPPQIVKMEASQVAQVAHAVAPPAPEFRTATEMKNVEQRGVPLPPRVNEPIFPKPTATPTPNLDGPADGAIFTDIKITIGKSPP